MRQQREQAEGQLQEMAKELKTA
jgi:hypothetical protein